MLQELDGKLIDLVARRAAKFTAWRPPKFTQLHFGASWREPCRAVTPKPVEFHGAHHGRSRRFEVLFVSRDRNAEEFAVHARLEKFSFPAVRFEQLGAIPIGQPQVREPDAVLADFRAILAGTRKQLLTVWSGCGGRRRDHIGFRSMRGLCPSHEHRGRRQERASDGSRVRADRPSDSRFPTPRTPRYAPAP